ncbi:Putative colanic biosynthesis UDP-glucose lipid carrier transferase [Fusobacterium necrogenes]|uniref:Colanic biosynthesis UDP-glucose lipid carrier transferase n=1 Tax=Fusobacterium necrogenes TaxID=858 RepID=A0A377GWA5_9FUSO|nr:exopolysaccharide biosynthesis polyprenyl glycosylphosphotransferase [Fusobacterium necrogenes]STO31277.1 Putative colanic biosynthesis UDP-glucose lipid carrier transferase [Fusobacterium necrogenes]
MEQEKGIILNTIYILILGAIFYLEKYIFISNENLFSFQSMIGFFIMMLGAYVTDNMKFQRYKYKIRSYIFVILIDFICFMVWFFYSWDLSLIIFMLIFVAAQMLLTVLISILVFKLRYVTIYGSGEMKNRVLESIQRFQDYKYIDFSSEKEEFSKFIKDNNVSLIILCKEKLVSNEIREILSMKLSGIEVKSYFDYMIENEGKIEVEFITEEWLLQAYGFKILSSQIQNNIKRFFDVVMSILIGVLALPVIFIAAIIVRVESPGPVIYSQNRVGENGKEFKVHKFRSMRNDAEKDGAKWAQLNDPRVTKFGNFMRKTRIDELPQLVNVLKGEMSFIGPRPERMVFIKELEKEIPYYNLRHMVKPGLTGWAQVMYPYGASVEDAKRKLEYDLYYIKHHSLYLDMVIMFMTFKTVIFGKGR